jgi:hypothetical protein
MKKHLVLIGIITIFLCIILSGCDQISNLFLSDEDKLVGTWNTDGIWMEVPIILEFFSNGTISAVVEMGTIDFTFNDGKWSMQEGTITMELGDLISLSTYTYQFSGENKILTLTDTETNETVRLTKQ